MGFLSRQSRHLCGIIHLWHKTKMINIDIHTSIYISVYENRMYAVITKHAFLIGTSSILIEGAALVIITILFRDMFKCESLVDSVTPPVESGDGLSADITDVWESSASYIFNLYVHTIHLFWPGIYSRLFRKANSTAFAVSEAGFSWASGHTSGF